MHYSHILLLIIAYVHYPVAASIVKQKSAPPERKQGPWRYQEIGRSRTDKRLPIRCRTWSWDGDAIMLRQYGVSSLWRLRDNQFKSIFKQSGIMDTCIQVTACAQTKALLRRADSTHYILDADRDRTLCDVADYRTYA
jgi:hypothetical protein